MFDSDLEQEYTIGIIKKVYEHFKWSSEYLSIAVALLEKIKALDGLRLWIRFGHIINENRDVVGAYGFNEKFIVSFDIGENEPRSLDIGCHDNPPVTIDIKRSSETNTAGYIFRLLMKGCEIYKLVVEHDNLASSLSLLAERAIRECSVSRGWQVC